ncbi:hypothetical protein Cylst_6351 (plasmid) [Cylindrospermum stagnale PCC 7417]|uniref:Lipocalin-like domain-containing protein n=1 Tax=Cylindrospermum stagnale PCC 7417 TaxID=56107 RepID=K9X946_9NOST|nr:hypothetical protein [Cylindrospermum stagnale]AFZ28571.1 hypothetical protein Cylst_6351 [Cylindrospermum stagnale PCC 7417]
MQFTGTWHIYEMSNWDEEYFNMEVQAYIEIDEKGNGEFQFGLVFGAIDGNLIKDGNANKLEFTWDGSDECDEASGSGWLKLQDKNTLTGNIKFHQGDSSTLLAKRA